MKNQSFKKRLGFAFNGVFVTFKNEPSFRWQILCGFSAYALLIFFRAEVMWWITFTITIALILSAELFNSALERAIDRLHPEKHSMIAEAKDCAAGAVLILSLASLVLLILFLIKELKLI